MRRCIFTFMSLFLLLTGCIHSIPQDSFVIRVDTGYGERNGKDYIKCWIDDSLFFEGTYINRFNDITLEHFEDCYGMEVARFNKKNRDSAKIKIRVISLDTVLYVGKKVIDTTFLYQINNIPEVVVSCTPSGGFLLWDTLRTNDYFYYEY